MDEELFDEDVTVWFGIVISVMTDPDELLEIVVEGVAELVVKGLPASPVYAFLLIPIGHTCATDVV